MTIIYVKWRKKLTMNREKAEQHITHLKEAHALLDKEIDARIKSGIYKDEELETMKKKRLQLKDNIENQTKNLRNL